MSSKRLGRISEEIKKTVSNIIRSGLKDPRISSMTSITKVEVTKDLRYANIYVSVLGDENSGTQTIKGLESAKGFVRREIGKNVQLRCTPEPLFFLDSSIEYGIKISKILNDLKTQDDDKGSV